MTDDNRSLTRRALGLIAAVAALASPPVRGEPVDDASERYRPRAHYTPRVGFMNDPNGLIHHDGEWTCTTNTTRSAPAARTCTGVMQSALTCCTGRSCRLRLATRRLGSRSAAAPCSTPATRAGCSRQESLAWWPSSPAPRRNTSARTSPAASTADAARLIRWQPGAGARQQLLP